MQRSLFRLTNPLRTFSAMSRYWNRTSIALIVHQLDRLSRNVSTISLHLAEKHSQSRTPISFYSQAMSATITVSESISRGSVRGKEKRAYSIR